MVLEPSLAGHLRPVGGVRTGAGSRGGGNLTGSGRRGREKGVGEGRGMGVGEGRWMRLGEEEGRSVILCRYIHIPDLQADQGEKLSRSCGSWLG